MKLFTKVLDFVLIVPRTLRLVTKSATASERKAPFWKVRMALIVILVFLTTPFMVPRNPRLRRWRLRRLMRGEEARRRRGITRPANTMSFRLLWEFVEQTRWEKVVPLLESRATPILQIKTAHSFSHLYLVNGRWKEAVAAADYGERMCDEWVKAHPERAREALMLRQTMLNWPLRPFEPKASTTAQGMEEMSKNQEDEREANLVDGGMMLAWRNAGLAKAFLADIAARRETGALAWPLVVTEEEKHPLGIGGAPFDLRFARQIGITDDEFEELFRRATDAA
jgi:hypothetical protein